MASLILVLREGAIKQAVERSTRTTPSTSRRSTGAAALLNERLLTDGRRATRRRPPDAEDDPIAAIAPRRVGERIVKVLREYDAAAVEEVFSDGLLNVMEAPEFAQSDKLRRSSPPSRTGPTSASSSAASRARPVQVFIGAENPRAEMRRRLARPRPVRRPGRAIGVVGVLGPTRMSYPQAIGTVRFVSGLMNELVDHLYA